jgi:phosphopantothenoylcysteine decarboxylase/phosphopantothenate--cysteine ligase
VTLVTAAELPAPVGVDVVRVETAGEMEAAVLAVADVADAVVMAAAMADFRPKAAASEKLRKDDGVPDLLLEPAPDVLAALARRRRPGQVLVGFAAETGDVVQRATEKLRRKGVDAIVGNNVLEPGAGFGHETNRTVVVEVGLPPRETPLMDKSDVAALVIDVVARRLANPRTGRTT